MSDLTDDDLVRLCRDGSDEAFAELVGRYRRLVFGIISRTLGDPGRAEDLAQDVFLRVFRSLPAHTPTSLDAWLDRITLNLYLDRLRRRQRIRFVTLPEEVEDSVANTGRDPHVDDRMFAPDVERALQALPRDCLVAVVLRDLDGFTYEEIAVSMNIRRGTVGSRIHRGRQQLRAALAHRAPPSGKGSTSIASVKSVGRSMVSSRS